MTEHKTDININEIDKYKKTEQDFYNGTQNRIQLHFGELKKGLTNLKTPHEKG